MKARITIEQLAILNSKQVEILQTLWEPDVGDWYTPLSGAMRRVTLMSFAHINFVAGLSEESKSMKVPMLNIGQMIGILGKGWESKVFTVDENLEITPLFVGELCDALWKHVKVLISVKEETYGKTGKK